MRARIEWKPQDLWIGAFWRTTLYKTVTYECWKLHVWVCILPCMPIHLTFTREKER